jgi:hypothetical protein
MKYINEEGGLTWPWLWVVDCEIYCACNLLCRCAVQARYCASSHVPHRAVQSGNTVIVSGCSVLALGILRAVHSAVQGTNSGKLE